MNSFVFTWRDKCSIVIFAILASALSGCLPTTILNGKFLKGFGPDGTLILGEVTYIYSKDEMKKEIEDNFGHKTLPMYQELLNNGLTDEDLIAGKVVVIVYQTYWHNRSRSHDFLDWAMVDKGITVTKGNIVKVEVRQPYAMVTGVLYNKMKDGDCQLIEGDRGALVTLNAVSPAGGPGTSNLYCPKLEQEGWQKRPFGMYKGGFVMTKPPKTSSF